jgi:hypothetical protein
MLRKRAGCQPQPTKANAQVEKEMKILGKHRRPASHNYDDELKTEWERSIFLLE